MKKLLFLIAAIFILSACSKDLNEKDKLETDKENESNEVGSLDLGTTEEIKSDLYKKYFEKSSNDIQSNVDQEIQNTEGRVEIEKINEDRKIFIGNGDYLPFLSDKSQFYIDYLYEDDDFSLAYIIFKGDNIDGKSIEEDLVIEVIKNNDIINIRQENFDGKEKSDINFDENFKKEIVESVKSFVSNPLFIN